MTNREAYIEKAKAQIDQWNAEINKMLANAAEAEADAKIEYQKQIDEMRNQRNEAKEQIKQMQSASNKAWDDMQAGFDKAWDDIQGSFQAALSRFK